MGHICTSILVEVREHPEGVSSLILQHVSQEFDLEHSLDLVVVAFIL